QSGLVGSKWNKKESFEEISPSKLELAKLKAFDLQNTLGESLKAAVDKVVEQAGKRAVVVQSPYADIQRQFADQLKAALASASTDVFWGDSPVLTVDE